MKSILRILPWAFALPLVLSCNLEKILHDNRTTGGLTEDRIVAGLKESLRVGSQEAALNLGRADGYLGDALVKVLLPEEVEEVFGMISRLESHPVWATVVRTAGRLVPTLTPLRDSLITALNRGAEHAAPASVNIFSSAIGGLSLQNGRDILFGDSVAATNYLESTTRLQLDSLFQPIIQSSLDVVQANRLWRQFSSGYNQVLTLYNSVQSNPGVQFAGGLPALDFPASLPTNLTAYTSGKALDGLFFKVAGQEASLRADPLQYLADLGSVVEEWAKDLLSEVFTADENE